MGGSVIGGEFDREGGMESDCGKPNGVPGARPAGFPPAEVGLPRTELQGVEGDDTADADETANCCGCCCPGG